MTDERKQRRIVQVSAIPAKDEDQTDIGLVAVDNEGIAWVCWYIQPGDTTDWEELPPLPSKP